MIKTIIFDFGGVIGSEADTTFFEILSKHGISKDRALKIWNKHYPKMEIGGEHIDAIWKTTKKYTTSDINIIISKHEKLISVNQDMLNLCKDLKQRGYKLGILANETLEWMSIKTKKGKLNDIFDIVYSSAILKSAKPFDESYLKILDKLDTKPKEALFIDNKERNIKAAKKLGIKSIIFKNIDQLKKELSQILDN